MLPTCTNCLKAGVTCVQPEKYATKAPEKDEYVMHLEKKVAMLEDLIARQQGQPRVAEACNGVKEAQAHHHHHAHGSLGHNHILSPGIPLPLQQGGSNSSPNAPSTPSEPPNRTVSILNVDPNSNSTAPQSFSVVSQRLQDSLWDSHLATETNVPVDPSSEGFLIPPQFDFSPYKGDPVEQPSSELADKLLETFFLKVHTRLPMVPRHEYQQMYRLRFDKPVGAFTSAAYTAYRVRCFRLYIAYAAAAMILDMADQYEGPDYMGYFYMAMRYGQCAKVDDPCLQIEACLFAIHVLVRCDNEVELYKKFLDIATMLSSQALLHKKETYEGLSRADSNRLKISFWATYNLERIVHSGLGRKKYRHLEGDITTDIDFDLEPPYAPKQVEGDGSERGDSGTSTPTISDDPMARINGSRVLKRILKLRRIESEIREHIYLEDKPLDEQILKVQPFLDKLEYCKTEIIQIGGMDKDLHHLHYSRVMRMLLQPFLGRLDPSSDLFRKCVTATEDMIKIFKEYFWNSQRGFTISSIHTIFVCGLTLLYSLWLSKHHFPIHILDGIRDCSVTLAIMSARTRLARGYRDTFENMTKSTLNFLISNGASGCINERVSKCDEAGCGEADPASVTAAAVAPVAAASPVGQYSELHPSYDVRVKREQQVAASPKPAVATTASVMEEPAPVIDYFMNNINDRPPLPNIPNNDFYYYDDDMQNVVQDISSWARQTNEIEVFENGTANAQVNTGLWRQLDYGFT
ncbi:hypothetical protein CJU90_1216 [Yarrowia sp. C11]|nr:hypothetical protein CKK34_2630 [Yarrowia sp. E02]KAG5373503.1 hypothetical protein CJU90_1216 [Yarrowia sp. C11]